MIKYTSLHCQPWARAHLFRKSIKWQKKQTNKRKRSTWSIEEARFLAVVRHLLLTVLRLANRSQQLLLFCKVGKVDGMLVYTRRRSNPGQLSVVVLDHHPCVLLCNQVKTWWCGQTASVSSWRVNNQPGDFLFIYLFIFAPISLIYHLVWAPSCLQNSINSSRYTFSQSGIFYGHS